MRNTIDTKKAWLMHKQGLTWREIGVILALEDRRYPAYHGISVWMAVKREIGHEKVRPDTLP